MRNPLSKLFPVETVHAHCDIPCGLYDPAYAQLAAQTVIRMHQLIAALEMPGSPDKAAMDKYGQQLGRYVAVKEEHSEIVKREIRVIWGDYFKPEHLEKFPDLHTTVWNIMKLASKTRQNIDLQAANDLLAEVQKFAEMFWASKGVATKRAPSNQAVGGESVVVA